MRQTSEGGELLAADMLATVSHELRSPLAVIKGTAQTLLRHGERLSPEERQEFFTAMTQASGRLEQIVEDMLELSQLEAGTYPFEPTLLSPPTLLQEVSQTTVGAEKENREVRVQTRTPPAEQEPPTPASLLVHGDRHLLRRFLDHALRNATLYSHVGSPIEIGFDTLSAGKSPLISQQNHHPETVAVIVALPHALADHPLVDLWVRDHGLGIAPEHLVRVGERFYRVDTRLTREQNGMGLGLSIAAQIATWHQGGLWIESEMGQGTTLHLDLVMDTALTEAPLA